MVSVSLGNWQSPRATLLMLLDLPDWLDPLDKQVNRSSVGHCTRSLHMLVHCPELVNCVEICQWFDILGVPTLRVVHCEQSIGVLQNSTMNNAVRLYTSFTYPSSALMMSSVLAT